MFVLQLMCFFVYACSTNVLVNKDWYNLRWIRKKTFFCVWDTVHAHSRCHQRLDKNELRLKN